jgi:AcrR family transcriptional regulator
MRRVAEELSVEAMSLYNHVDDKAAMLDGIFETVLRELPPSRPFRSWKSALDARARSLRAVLTKHPNVLPLFATRPPATRASFVPVEGALAILQNAGFSEEDSLRALNVLVAFVVGHTLATASPTAPQEASHPDYDRLSDRTFPRVRKAVLLLAGNTADKEFAFGIQAMLTGLELRLSKYGRKKKFGR